MTFIRSVSETNPVVGFSKESPSSHISQEVGTCPKVAGNETLSHEPDLASLSREK